MPRLALPHAFLVLALCPFRSGCAGRSVDEARDGSPCTVVAQVRSALAGDQGPLQVHARQTRARSAATILRRRQQIAGV